MSYLVKAGGLEKINLAPESLVEEVLQNVAVILSTAQYSVPLARRLGLPMRFLDKPLPVAQAMLVAEVNEAIKEQEPRATVVETKFELDEENPGKLIPIVEVEINGE